MITEILKKKDHSNLTVKEKMSNLEQEEMGFINHPHPLSSCQEDEEDLLLLHQTTSSTLDSSSYTQNHLHCTNCGYSHKRSSPEPSSFPAQPRNKKPNNHLPSLNGFSKIALPTDDQLLLRRCSSDPISPPRSPPLKAETPRPETPLSAVRASAAQLPPRAPTLTRSVSDPNPSPSNTCGTMGGGYESPNDKQRLRRMRDCIREMNKWWDEILPEEQAAAINNNNISATTENCDEDIEESVSVERAGEFLIIHFKCPCGKGYQILISGKNCYYKLI